MACCICHTDRRQLLCRTCANTAVFLQAILRQLEQSTRRKFILDRNLCLLLDAKVVATRGQLLKQSSILRSTRAALGSLRARTAAALLKRTEVEKHLASFEEKRGGSNSALAEADLANDIRQKILHLRVLQDEVRTELHKHARVLLGILPISFSETLTEATQQAAATRNPDVSVCGCQLPDVQSITSAAMNLQTMSTALGHLVLLVSILSTLLMAPLVNHICFRGSTSEIWQPTSFWETRRRKKCKVLKLYVEQTSSLHGALHPEGSPLLGIDGRGIVHSGFKFGLRAIRNGRCWNSTDISNLSIHQARFEVLDIDQGLRIGADQWPDTVELATLAGMVSLLNLVSLRRSAPCGQPRSASGHRRQWEAVALAIHQLLRMICVIYNDQHWLGQRSAAQGCSPFVMLAGLCRQLTSSKSDGLAESLCQPSWQSLGSRTSLDAAMWDGDQHTEEFEGWDLVQRPSSLSAATNDRVDPLRMPPTPSDTDELIRHWERAMITDSSSMQQDNRSLAPAPLGNRFLPLGRVALAAAERLLQSFGRDELT